jgi:hypothetical protein
MVISRRKDTPTERAQDPAVDRVLLREELFLLARVFTELFLGLEYLDLLFVPFDEVDEIDVLREDGLRCGEIAQLIKSKGVPGRERAA